MFFLSLFQAAQIGEDPAPNASSLIASYDAALAAVAQQAQTQPTATDLSSELSALRQELQVLPVVGTPPLDVVTAVGNNTNKPITFAGQAGTYIGNSGTALDFADTVGVVVGTATPGLAPKANDSQWLGGTALRWANVYSVLGNFSGNITWGAYSIAVPTGATTTFLRNDGTWAAPTSVASLFNNPYTYKFSGANVAIGTSVGTFSSTLPTGTSPSTNEWLEVIIDTTSYWVPIWVK